MKTCEVKISKERTIIIDAEDKDKITGNVYVTMNACSLELEKNKRRRKYKRLSHIFLGITDSNKTKIIHKNGNIFDLRKANLGYRADCTRQHIIKDDYCLIALAGGEYAIIDRDDLDKVKDYHWSKVWNKNSLYPYAASRDKQGKRFKMHHVILNILDKGLSVDHKNRNGLDNRKCNLRICTASENGANKIKSTRGVSKFKGVCPDSYNSERWRAYIVKDKKQYMLGYFYNEVEAARAYNKAAVVLFGEFARVNNLSDYKESPIKILNL